MKKSLLTTLFLLYCFMSYGLVYTVTVPDGTVECYIAGGQTGWAQKKMDKIGDNKFQIDLPEATASHKYKYCSGPGWAFVEKNASGEEIGDRSYSENDVVERWASVYYPELTEGNITITATIPSDTPAENSIYIAGSFQGYKPTVALKMDKTGDYTYTVTIQSVTQINYKILCGKSWDNVEMAADGQDISDRTASTANPTVNITVEKWKSTDVIPMSYTYIDEALDFEPYLSGSRNIWVYLPKDYTTNTGKSYPVLYMHDGQNVFEQGDFGTWEAHKAFEALQDKGKEVGIVVAINNGAGRMSEYTPFPNTSNAPIAKGDEYLQAIINVIMPYINANYRTLTGPENTGIAGSSLGGLISYYAGLKHPDVFGRIGAMSPSFWYCKNDLSDYVNNWTADANTAKARIYFICGDSEGSNPSSMITDMQEFYDKTKSKGFLENNLKHEVVVGGAHNEASWAAQIERVYDFIFDKNAGVSIEKDNTDVSDVIVTARGNSLTVNNQALNSSVDFNLFDVSGRLIANKKIENSEVISNLTSGIYIYKVQTSNKEVYAKKILIH